MAQTLGLGWSRHKLPALVLSALLACALLATPEVSASLERAANSFVDVIVRAEPGSTEAARSSVEHAGGSVQRPLRIINGFEARVPEESRTGSRRLAIHLLGDSGCSGRDAARGRWFRPHPGYRLAARIPLLPSERVRCGETDLKVRAWT